jgi:ubiquinone/menaquinone biosynthesis C-methylase UbiE
MDSGYRRPFVQTADDTIATHPIATHPIDTHPIDTHPIDKEHAAEMQGYDASTYGRSFADVYDEWYHDVSDVHATVASVAARANGRRVLELGVGTGRIALPLAALGVDITGIDASTEMLERARAKAPVDGSRLVALVEGDMAELPVDGPFGVVFVAFNTFFNLTDAAAQQRCFSRVAQVLEPGGWFAIEAFVPPDPAPDEIDSGVSVRTIELDQVVLTVARRDPVAQTIVGQHIEITNAGARLRPWFVRYAGPEELDSMARVAGLERAERHGDWSGSPFTDESPAHVSWYVNPATASGAPRADSV